MSDRRSESRGRSRTPTPPVPAEDDARQSRDNNAPFLNGTGIKSRTPSRTPTRRSRSYSRSRSPRGRSRSASKSRSRSRSRSDSPNRPRSAKIVIEKLTKNVNVTHLREIFSTYGEIQDLEMPMNKHFMTNRGIAYVLFSQPSYAESAIANMHEAQLDGALISVSIVLPRRRFSRSPPPMRPPPNRFGEPHRHREGGPPQRPPRGGGGYGRPPPPGREESHGAGVRQGGEEVRQGEREAQATVAVHLHVGSTVEGDDAAQATQATAEAEAAARAEIAAVGEDRRVCLHDEITVAGPCPAQAIRASVGAKVAESADNVDDKWARIDDKIHHTVNGNGDHTARATQTTAGAEAVASAGTDGCNHDLEIILPGAMAAHSDQAFEPARAVRILVGAPAAPAGATAGTVMVEDNSSSSAIFVGAHPADNPLQPC